MPCREAPGAAVPVVVGAQPAAGRSVGGAARPRAGPGSPPPGLGGGTLWLHKYFLGRRSYWMILRHCGPSVAPFPRARCCRGSGAGAGGDVRASVGEWRGAAAGGRGGYRTRQRVGAREPGTVPVVGKGSAFWSCQRHAAPRTRVCGARPRTGWELRCWCCGGVRLLALAAWCTCIRRGKAPRSTWSQKVPAHLFLLWSPPAGTHDSAEKLFLLPGNRGSFVVLLGTRPALNWLLANASAIFSLNYSLRANSPITNPAS